MSARALVFQPRLPARRGRLGVTAVAGLVAVALAAGWLATASVTYALGLVAGVALLVLVAARVDALPLFLIFTMFTESFAFGPSVRIGRVAAVLALLVMALYVLRNGTNGLGWPMLLWLALATGLWICASALWAHSSKAVEAFFGRWLLAAAYMVTFAILVRTRRQLRATFVALGLGSLVFGALSFAGYVTHGNTYLAQGLGATGGASDHNYFAVYQVVALPAALALSVLERRPRRRLLWFAVVGTIVLSVVASLSRTGLLALVGAVGLTLVFPSRVFFRRGAHKASYVVALIVAVAVVGVSGSTPFVKRAQSILKSDPVAGHAGSGRVDLWRAAWTGYRQHPWLGLGAGGFPPMSVQLLQETPGADVSAAYAQQGMVVHNMYLETLVEMGPVGEAILLALLFLTGRAFLGAYRRSRERADAEIATISIALLVSLAAYCVAGFFLSIEDNKPLWILIGLALALQTITRAGAQTLAAVELPTAVTPAGPRPRAPYDRRVGGPQDAAGRLAQRERRAEEHWHALEVERERVERRGSLLDVRTHRLDARERALEERFAELEQMVAEAIAPRAAELEARERDLEGRVAAVTTRERELVRRVALLEREAAAAAADRVAELDAREQRLVELEQRVGATVAEIDAREARAAEVERSAVEATRGLERMQAELAEREARAAELERRASEAERGFEARRVRTAELEQRLTALAAAVEEREARAEELERRAGLAARELEDRAARAAAVAEQLAALRGEVEERQARAAELARELGERQKALARAAATAHELETREARAAALEQRLAALGAEVEERQAQAAELERRAGEAARDLEDRAARTAELERQLAALRGEVEERQARAAELARELAERQGTLARADATAHEVETCEAHAAALEQRLAALGAEVEEREAHAAELERRAGEAAQELEDRAARTGELERSAAAAARELERARAELEARQARAAELERRAVAAAEELEAREARAAALEERLGALGAGVEEQEARAAELERRAGEAARELEGRTARTAELEQQLAALRGEVEERQALATELAREVAARQQTLARADETARELAAREARSAELERRLAALQAELDTRHAWAAEAERELAQRRELLDRRARAIADREGALVARVGELAKPAQAAPAQPPSVPAAPAVAAAPPRSGAFNLDDLERAVDARPGNPRAEEWRYYLLYLRDFAALDGTLPRNFDALVDEVFGELVGA